MVIFNSYVNLPEAKSIVWQSPLKSPVSPNEELIQVAEEGPVHMGNSNKSHPTSPGWLDWELNIPLVMTNIAMENLV